MRWSEHDKWALQMGIPPEVSREVNTVIDAVEQGKNIPKEYKRVLRGCAEDWREENAPNSKSSFDLVVSDYSAREHDVERSSKTGGDIAAEVHLCAMRKMGEEYVQAWYLHHHLDFLSESWDGEESSLDGLMNEYRERHPLTYSSDVEGFLRDLCEELRHDLDRHLNH